MTFTLTFTHPSEREPFTDPSRTFTREAKPQVRTFTLTFTRPHAPHLHVFPPLFRGGKT